MNPKEAISEGFVLGKAWAKQIGTEVRIGRQVKTLEKISDRMKRKAAKVGIVVTEVQREIIGRTESQVQHFSSMDLSDPVKQASIPVPKILAKESATTHLVAIDANLQAIYRVRQTVIDNRARLKNATGDYIKGLFS